MRVPKFRIQGMMAAIAIIALVLGYNRFMKRRAEWHAAESMSLVRSVRPELLQFMKDQLKVMNDRLANPAVEFPQEEFQRRQDRLAAASDWVRYHNQMAERCRAASRRPWVLFRRFPKRPRYVFAVDPALSHP